MVNEREILGKVQCVFRNVLDNENIVLDKSMSSDDIEEYDSLSHIQIVVAIEKEFDIKFSARDILLWDNIGEMVDCIIKYLK